MRKNTKIDISNVNFQKLVKKAVSYFKPPEQLSLKEWSDKYRILQAENSAEPGKWRTSRTPYLEEIMNAFNDSKVKQEVVVASSQVGKTECELNMLGYAIDIDPGPIMWVTPTQDNAEDFSKRRIAPMIRDTKPLRKKVADSKSRNSNNTVLKKRYPGGMLTLTGSNSPANLASVPCRYVFGDEIDRWATDAGGEGDPWSLLKARTTTFFNHKMVQVSTPTIKGHSAIEKAFKLGTQEYWCVECPHCHEYNFIEFEQIKFEYKVNKIDGNKQFIVEKVEYACPECGCISSEYEIKHSNYKWIAKNPEAYQNGVRSFWINSFSSPWMGWDEIVLSFLEAENDPKKLKTVYNTLLGKLWEDRSTHIDEDVILDRRENYEAELPDGVLCLTCGVDTQDNRLEYEVVGHGLNRITWGIRKGIIMGKPDNYDTWNNLDGIIEHEYSFKDGKKLKISATFVDSGGHYTQEVYENCLKRFNKRVFAIKGKGGDGIPYVSPPSKVNVVKEDARGRKVIFGKCFLYTLGVDSGKEKIMSALEVQTPGEQRYCHFPLDEELGYDRNFAIGILSEQLTFKNGKWRWEKIPGHERNEALDCRNYAMAAFRAISPNMEALDKAFKGIKFEKKEVKKPVKKKQKRQDFSKYYD